nr:hypothetical protein [Tanacetum cinerariifolium]
MKKNILRLQVSTSPGSQVTTTSLQVSSSTGLQVTTTTAPQVTSSTGLLLQVTTTSSPLKNDHCFQESKNDKLSVLRINCFKMKILIIDEKAILVDNEGKPLRKVDDDSEDEVARVDNEMVSFLAKKDGYGIQSLLEQWKDSHELDDYEYDPYDDDMYEGQEIL